ncbi:hypothetical protein ABZY44_22535 [Streptomyces sp. NPDC006544]|uniref:hypothetical protein n=1 Tax=Streptomyces sp. NPDC006544 TaxID=3154583 RepID=UPI0033A0DA10
MNSSNQGDPASHTGAPRAHGRTLTEGTGAEQQQPPFRHEPYLDGLFTYCLSVLCDHDTATDVLGDVLAVAERHPGRCPDEGDRRAWLYALARWACLRRLAERRRTRRGHGYGHGYAGAHSARRAPERGGRDRVPGPAPVHATGTAAADVNAASNAAWPAGAPAGGLDVSAYRRTELARLAWPEAAGTTPEQREALELAVRHRLGVPELAAVLGTPPAAARELLSGAACEVERTRAALAVVETGSCPTVSRLTGDDGEGGGDGNLLLSSSLRAELVRHVDDCPRCRRVAERVGAGGPWPGSGGIDTAATLPLVPAPRTAVRVAMLRSGSGRRVPGSGPRFNRTGFPMDPKDRVARRDRLRARAVTTTVVATVVAAPVLALWAAYRGAPSTGESVGGGATRISASEAELPPPRTDGRPLTAYENAGNTAPVTDGPDFATGAAAPDVSVEVISSGAPPSATPGAPGRLTAAASSHGSTTVLTLTAWGGAPVYWRLWSDGPWLRASRTAGRLAPGESVTLRIDVDPRSQPVGAWSARVGVDPGGAVISIQGRGRPAATPTPTPTPTDPPTPTPPASPPPTPTPTPTPTPSPTPTPTPTPSPAQSPEQSPDPSTGAGSPA